MASEKRPKKVDILGFVSFGFFLILVGVIFINTPNLTEEIQNFFTDFDLVEVFPNILLPAPRNHPVIYTAVAEFSFAFGLFQIVLLALRFIAKDTLSRKAETFSSIFFWLGMGLGFNMLAAEQIGWFALVAWFIIFVGLSIVIRSLTVLLLKSRRKPQKAEFQPPTQV